MNPRYLAHAIADAMRDRVIAAHRFLAEIEALEQSGIPVEIVRDAMERKAVATPATDAVKAWDGRGPLVLHGAVDNGKSHAAALWARKRWRQGRPTVWLSCVTLLSFDELDRVLERTKRAPAVVLDELGAGLGGTAGCRTKIAAWLQDRGQRPTFVTSNANEAQMEIYLGARLLSRMKQAGECIWLETSANLRTREREADPETGRSPRWRGEKWLVDTVGYEPVDTYDAEANRVVHGCRVGDALEGVSVERLEQLAAKFKLDRGELERSAAEIGRDLDRVVSKVAKWKPPPMETATKMSEIVQMADKDLRAKKKIAADLNKLRRPTTSELPPNKLGPGDHRSLLRRNGFSVVPTAGGYNVTYRPKGGEAKRMNAEPLASTDVAWDFAGRVMTS